MNLVRRAQVVAGVVVASAAAGASAGLLIAGCMIVTKLGHTQPATIWELIKLGSQTGALFGVLLGPPMVLGLLRRVPLRRLATDAFIAATYGGVVGFALSMAFAQPRPTVSLIVAGGVAGFSIAALRLWRRGRAYPTFSSPLGPYMEGTGRSTMRK
ncbi:MAG TPA: hypothetical protein VGM67_06185 [Gemmatimonadaceae bacterium]|jgi:hypothetical protein